ncbi:hypothetical protein N7513_013348 [Penicillium frequentans]|nr:hypothetical protein N7513_013348 [Penicillium glabrum]
MEIVMMEQNKASGQTVWDLLDTFLPGGADRQERQKEEQDRLYRDKTATMRIKEMEETRLLGVIQTHEANIKSSRRQAFSIEYDIRRMTEEKDLKDREERVKLAEQMEREGWAYAHWSQTESWAKGAPNPTDCKHGARWSRVEGRFRCSCCAEDTQRFTFQCAGCKKITCASCRDELRQSRFKEEKNDQIAIGSAFWEPAILPGLQVAYMKHEDAVDAVVSLPFKELAHVAEYPYSVDHSIH